MIKKSTYRIKNAMTLLVISVIMIVLISAFHYFLNDKINPAEKKSECKQIKSAFTGFKNIIHDSLTKKSDTVKEIEKKKDSLIVPTKPQIYAFTDKSIFTGVLPAFDNNPLKDLRSVDGLDMYIGKSGGSVTGAAVTTYSDKGYNGKIILLVGFKTDGTINSVSVISQNETPFMGSQITESEFKDQFKEKNPATYKLTVKNDGGDVDAISGSTISSRAFCDAVQKAYDAYIKGMKK